MGEQWRVEVWSWQLFDFRLRIRDGKEVITVQIADRVRHRTMKW